MFDAGHFVLIPVNGLLQCQRIRKSDYMAADLHSRPVRGGCHLLSPEYAYFACVYRVIGLMQENFLERGSTKTSVVTGDGQILGMTGLELGQHREQKTRNASPTKSGSRSNSPRNRSRAPDEEDCNSGSLSSTDRDDVECDSDSGVDVSEWTRGRGRTTDLEEMRRRDQTKRRKILTEHVRNVQ